ncbi:MAG: hypothetical protein HY060_12750, partial [Proteobacteria bacterium]|nr:hypothetical protein [Pseudomonadota bacterium]
MRYLLLASLLLASGTLFGVSHADPALPQGWRLPRPDELSSPHDIVQWRDDSPDREAVARGDFDGDGRQDEARLLVSADGKKYALFVLLGSGRAVRLVIDDVDGLSIMGIAALPPGRHRTACGKGFVECRGEP